MIDIAFSFLIGIFFLVDFYCFKNAIGPIEYETTFVYSDIVVTSLLSITITVISILIAFPKNELYGISLKDIQKILGNRYYSLLHIFVDCCLIFGLNLIFKFLNYRFSGEILELLTIIMCLIFAIQQFSLLLESKKSCMNLIALSFKDYYIENKEEFIKKKSNSEGDKESEKRKEISNIYTRLLRNYILIEGVESTFKELKKRIGIKNNIRLINTLLLQQERFLFELRDFIVANEKNGILDKYDGLSVTNSLITASENIELVLSDFQYGFLDNENWRVIVDSTINIHKTIGLLKNKELENECFKYLFEWIMLPKSYGIQEEINKILNKLKRESFETNDFDYSNVLDINDLNKMLKEYGKGSFSKIRKKEKQKIFDCLNSFLNVLEKSIKNINLYLSYISLKTMWNDDAYFLELYELSFIYYLFGKETNDYTDYSFFITFIIIYFLDYKRNTDSSNIEKFFSNSDNVLDNPFISWKKEFKKYLEKELGFDELIYMLDNLLKYYNVSGFNVYMLTKQTTVVNVFRYNRNKLSENILFKYWFGCVCAHYKFDKAKITEFINKYLTKDESNGLPKEDKIYNRFKFTQVNAKNDKSYFYFLSFVLDYNVTQEQYNNIRCILNDLFENKVK